MTEEMRHPDVFSCSEQQRSIKCVSYSKQYYSASFFSLSIKAEINTECYRNFSQTVKSSQCKRILSWQHTSLTRSSLINQIKISGAEAHILSFSCHTFLFCGACVQPQQNFTSDSSAIRSTRFSDKLSVALNNLLKSFFIQAQRLVCDILVTKMCSPQPGGKWLWEVQHVQPHWLT